MNVINTKFSDVKIIEPKLVSDDRGFFKEIYRSSLLAEITGTSQVFVQENYSRSKRGVLRGLHYQLSPMEQGKLIGIVNGEILDVIVDLRRDSRAFGEWLAVTLSSENQRQLWVPAGYAHGFYVRSETADCVYRATNYYSPELERSVYWADPDLSIDWQLDTEPVVSQKDCKATPFKLADYL